MIDLHTHTTHSDGTDDVITLLKNAEQIKLEALSITDHVTCKAYEELKSVNIQNYYTGKLIRGCELYTAIDGQTIELLGYNINTDLFNKTLPNIYMSEAEDNKYQTEKLLDICKKLGIYMDYSSIQVNYDTEFGGDVILREIIKYSQNKKILDNEKAWNDSNVFYRECMTNSTSKFFIDKSSFYPKIDEVIDLIRSAGGLVFIPHIFIYGDNSMKFFDTLTNNYKIDGIECYYTVFTNEQNKFLLDYCYENNLLISGGSDYHGKNKPGASLGVGGGALNIPSSILHNWT
ncbi:MAG: PHP domain-containing protein [Lachnospiraceae bacterium]|jgi:predicted metal-dependent phosphoesterase TrpH|nr:PHP domain-containing protein [Lachnospiraceae bacterium]